MSERIAQLEAQVEALKAEIRQLNSNQQILKDVLKETQQQLQQLMRYVKNDRNNDQN